MIKRIEVSVVIPVFNGALTLGKALQSVFAQTMDEIEIIVVDDGSTDGTGQVLKEQNDPRLRILQQKKSGAATARNTGVKEAKGRFIAFLDADDCWSENKLELQLKQIKKDRSFRMIFGHVMEFTDERSLDGSLTATPGRILAGYSPITLLISKTDFLEVGWFDQRYTVAEFIQWFDRAKGCGFRVHLMPEILAYRRIHAGNRDRLTRPDTRQYAAVIKESLDRRRKG
jgi:glycosyltransferase involved in cell wall biosynthesis